jgi:hypothetical protein
MDSLAEIKQNENLIINSDEIEEEIDAYFDNITKEELIKDLNEVGIEVEEIEKNNDSDYVTGVDAYICNQDGDYIFESNKKNNVQTAEDNEMELLAA